MNKRLFFVTVIVAMVSTLLPLTATAQEGPKPEAVGLRPDAPPYALHGPYWVGTMEMVVEPDSERPLPLTVWYPALNPEDLAEEVEYRDDGVPGPVYGHAISDAEIDPSGGPYPLVIFSHALGIVRISYPHYTEHLASYGFVVLAPNHPDDAPFNRGESPHRTNILRPQEVIRVVDFAVAIPGAGEMFEGLIDTDNIAVAGHSMGGYTALAATGAQLDLKAHATWCDENPPADPGMCASFLDHQEELAALAGLDAVPEGLWPPIADNRVKSIIALAPAHPSAFGPDGLAAVTVPVMIMAAGQDQVTPPEYHAYLGYDWLPTDQKALVVFAGANHFLFGVGHDAIPWFPPEGFFMCSDPVWDMDRAHDLSNHFVTAFLLATLKGNTEATAALAPDAVQFPGITYEAQGF